MPCNSHKYNNNKNNNATQPYYGLTSEACCCNIEKEKLKKIYIFIYNIEMFILFSFFRCSFIRNWTKHIH